MAQELLGWDQDPGEGHAIAHDLIGRPDTKVKAWCWSNSRGEFTGRSGMMNVSYKHVYAIFTHLSTYLYPYQSMSIYIYVSIVSFSISPSMHGWV